MKFKKITTLILAGMMCFSNVAYASEELPADALTAPIEETDLDVVEDEEGTSEFKKSEDVPDDGSVIDDTGLFSSIIEDPDVVYLDEDVSADSVEPEFLALDFDKELQIWNMLDEDREELVQSYDVVVPEGTEFPVTITMEAPVEEDDEVYVYHYLESENDWETITPDLVTDGYVTATFESLSPVGIIKVNSEVSDITDTLTYQEFTEYVDDIAINVAGEIPEGYYLSVEALSVSDYSTLIEDATGNVTAAVYDIKITDGENEYQPSEYGKTLSVAFSGLESVNEGQMNVVHIDEENEIVEQKGISVNTVTSLDTIGFETDSFSPYALVLATSRLQVEEGIDASLPFVDEYYGTTTSTIFHMYLTYNSSEKEAFCLDHGLSASTGDTFVQNGQYSSSPEVRKILTAYYADENGSSYTLSYAEAQALIWAAQAGYDTASDKDSSGKLDYVELMQAIGDNDEATNAQAVATIEGVTTSATFYAWDPSSSYDESAGTYIRNPSKQRFVTLLGKAPVIAADITDIDSDLWQVGDNAYAYIDSSKTLHIVGYGYCWDTKDHVFVSPSSYNLSQYTPVGDPVPYWDTENNQYKDYESIVIAPEIEGIGSHMFIESGAIEGNVSYYRYVGEGAFHGCRFSSPTMEICDVEYIGDYAYSGSNLTNVVLNSQAGIAVIGEYAFYNCDSLYDIDFLDTKVQEVGAYAFSQCSSLDNVVMNAVVWGPQCFANCSNLATATIGENVLTLGNAIFRGDHALSELNYNAPNAQMEPANWSILNSSTGDSVVVNIGSNVTSLPAYIFADKSVVEVNFNGTNLKTIGDHCFQDSSVSVMEFPEGLESIGQYAIHRCSNLTQLTIPESVTDIGVPLAGSSTSTIPVQELNYNAVNATLTGTQRVPLIYGTTVDSRVINIGERVAVIPAYAFYLLTTTGINFAGNSVEEIGKYAFDSSFITAEAFDIPDGVKIIGEYAFARWDNLSTIGLPDSIEEIEETAFYFNNSAKYDYDRDGRLGNDAITTTLVCSDDNTVARTYNWLSADNRYVANALAYKYTVTLPMSIELVDPGDHVYEGLLPVAINVLQDLDSPLSVVLTKGTFKNADNIVWDDLTLDQTTPSETVQSANDYTFDCFISGEPPVDGTFTGVITCTVTE